MLNNLCLAGNPNCGKTTLYNLLTGKSERVGNRAGVTVESKTGRYKKDKRVKITDLPGAYSLENGSDDEKIAAEHIVSSVGAIINVVDGTNLKRSLRLTAELTRQNKPMVIAINFCDELKKYGIRIDAAALGKNFGVPVVMISARKNTGIDELMAAVENARVPRKITVTETENFIETVLETALKVKPVKTQAFTDRADKILMHKIWGIPIFAAVIISVYFLTSWVGGFFGDKIAGLFATFSESVGTSLRQSGAADWFIGLVTNALITGVGAVLSFLPQILILFFMLEIIEESGYLARAAFLLDGIMSKAGFGGKSLVSLGVSCGCAVSGIMTTRTVDDENERRLTVYLSPFMPCGAKTAVFAWLSGLLFGGNPLICASLYFLSIISVAVFGSLLSRFKRFKGANGLVMEIPVLRVPSFRGVFGALKEKTVDFMLKAGSVIFLVSVVVWMLQSFGINGFTTDIKQSFLYLIGDKIKILFVPLGFGTWQSAVAVVASVFAKEAVIQTLSMVAGNPAVLFYSGYSAYAFMAFILLAPPCAAALTVARNELKSRKDFWFMILFQLSAAYITALIINIFGVLAENYGAVLVSLTFIAAGVIISVIILVKKRGCGLCSACGRKKCKRKKANTTI